MSLHLPDHIHQTGPDRVKGLIKQAIQRVQMLYQHVETWIAKLQQAQHDFDQSKVEVDNIEFIFTWRDGTAQEWELYDELRDEKTYCLARIQEAKMQIDEALEETQKEIRQAKHYLSLLENADEGTWMNIDDL